MGTGRSVVKNERERATGGRSVSPARRAAYEILRRVDDEGAFAAPLLASAANDLSAEDRALCNELVLGVLRRRLWLDKSLEYFAGRKIESLDAPVRRSLRLGLYQLRFLTRVPARAAVNESVNIAHAQRMRSAAPFINAVLRRATREPDYDPAISLTNPFEKIAVETSHPVWLIERWAASFGVEEAADFASANNAPARLAFRVNALRDGETDVLENLRAAGVEIAPSRVAPDAYRVEGGEGSGAALRALAAEGLVYMQDEASQLVAHVVGARAGERVLDVCAAPGSKTTHLASLTHGEAMIVAGDLHAHRLRLVRETCARLGVNNIRTVVLDAEARLPFADESFDRVLVDAPCTGTGTLRHNPEIRWRLTPGDIAELAAKQRKILAEASRVVRRGGRLVYSTCSVEREENEEVVAAFLESHGGFQQVSVNPAPVELFVSSGIARTWPHRHDTDGFFVTALERQEAVSRAGHTSRRQIQQA